jgi:TolB-like protein
MRALLLGLLLLAASPPAVATAPTAAATTATASPTPGRVRVLVVDFKANDVPAATAATVTGFVVASLGVYRTLDVVSGEDVRNMIALEATRSAAGCDEASCLSEISDALGAQLVVSGAVARLGNASVVTINLFDSTRAQALGRVTTQTTRSERLPGRIARRLHELVRPYHEEHNLVLRAPPPPEPGPDPAPWLMAGSGAGAVVLGGVAAVVGTLPWLSYNDASGRVIAAEDRFLAGDSGALDDARAAQTELAAARAAYNAWGFLLIDGGAVLGTLGLAAAIGGTVWGLSTAEEPDPDTPSTSMSPAGAPEQSNTAATGSTP